MFEFVRTHNRLLFFVLVLLIFPSFVFFGVQGYSRFNDASTVPVARVDGQKVTRAEWDAAHRRQVEQMRNQMPGVDVKLFDTPEARRETLDQIVRWLARTCRRATTGWCASCRASRNWPRSSGPTAASTSPRTR